MRELLPLLAFFAFLGSAPAQQTNQLFGHVGDYGLAGQGSVECKLTLISPNPRTVNGIFVRQDPVISVSTPDGAFGFTNIQWGRYRLDFSGERGTPFMLVVDTNTVGVLPLATLAATQAAFPPNPATSYYTKAQIDAMFPTLPFPYGNANRSDITNTVVVAIPTNFWSASAVAWISNLTQYFQPASANLSGWAQIPTNALSSAGSGGTNVIAGSTIHAEDGLVYQILGRVVDGQVLTSLSPLWPIPVGSSTTRIIAEDGSSYDLVGRTVDGQTVLAIIPTP